MSILSISRHFENGKELKPLDRDEDRLFSKRASFNMPYTETVRKHEKMVGCVVESRKEIQICKER